MIRARIAKDMRLISPCRLRTRLYLCGLALVIGLSPARVSAQNASAPGGPVATLRVQTNLVQIPVLVLTRDREKLYSAPALNRFVIRLAERPLDPPQVCAP